MDIWPAKSDDESKKPFAFYHADLGPTNIKIRVEIEEAKLTKILNWGVIGYLPIELICTKPYVSPI